MSKAEDIKAARVDDLMANHGYTFVHFKGGDLMRGPGTKGFIPFDHRLFSNLVLSAYKGLTENMISDFARTVKTLAPDWSSKSHLVGFRDKVWDTKTLSWSDNEIDFIYSTDIVPQPPESNGYRAAQKFFLQLSKGDPDLAHDYVQAMAPLLMSKRPTGVIWFIGDGSNGKSSVLNALYLVFGKHFSSLTLAAIEAGTATPSLGGVLGNIVREASEARVEDSERYKAIGTHEPFAIRRLYTQENITVDTNFHTIFNANTIPVFGDKTQGVRRRTLPIEFPAIFAEDSTFEDRTFTPEFLGGMVTLILEATHTLRDNGYRYDWSERTMRLKAGYDSEVNSAEAFVIHLVESKVLGFSNYGHIKMNYDDWCRVNGFIPLGITTLKRNILLGFGANKKSVRIDGRVRNIMLSDKAVDEMDTLVWLDNGYGVATPEEPLKEPTKVENERLSHDW